MHAPWGVEGRKFITVSSHHHKLHNVLHGTNPPLTPPSVPAPLLRLGYKKEWGKILWRGSHVREVLTCTCYHCLKMDQTGFLFRVSLKKVEDPKWYHWLKTPETATISLCDSFHKDTVSKTATTGSAYSMNVLACCTCLTSTEHLLHVAISQRAILFRPSPATTPPPFVPLFDIYTFALGVGARLLFSCSEMKLGMLVQKPSVETVQHANVTTSRSDA